MQKKKKHVLVVDDVATNLRYIGEVLRDDYSISLAKSGNQALKMLEKISADLILLDIKMPIMDGYEFLEKIRSIDKYKKIPVIFLSADNEEDLENKVLECGANGFIKKPFEPQFMLAKIETVLKKED